MDSGKKKALGTAVGDSVVLNLTLVTSSKSLPYKPKRYVQRKSPELSWGMHLCLQFYLGTTRLQLEHKGDVNHVFTNIANIVPAFGFIGIPVIGWLLDNKGYGITLGTINCMGVLASIFQAVPSLGFQVCVLYHSVQVKRERGGGDMVKGETGGKTFRIELATFLSDIEVAKTVHYWSMYWGTINCMGVLACIFQAVPSLCFRVCQPSC
jgi:hypothetical protein